MNETTRLMNRLQNRVAIVTGAAGGMGKAIAMLFAKEGANVLATDVQAAKLNEWVAEAKKQSATIEALPHDVASRKDWETVAAKAVELYGKIDILINNAGIYPPGASTENTTPELWDKVIAINLTGPFTGVLVCLPHLKAAGGGAIVNIASIAANVGGNGAAYTASKGGLRLLTKDMAVEFAPYKIRVNSIHPGGVLTPMTDFMVNMEGAGELLKNMCPMGRMGTADEIANAALYLASEESSYVTGAELVVDGGLVAR